MSAIKSLILVAQCFITFMEAGYDGSVPPVEYQFGTWL